MTEHAAPNPTVLNPAPASAQAAGEPATVVVEPRSGWRLIDLREMRDYTDLFLFLVWRAIKVRYAQSAIGIGWVLVQPLASMVVFTLIFGGLVGVSSDGQPYALFAFVALVPWTYFSNALTQATQSLSNDTALISKIYFPRMILPMAMVTARLVDFFIALVIMAVILLAFGQVPNAGILMLPPLILMMVMTAGGLGLWLTALSIQYRDVNHASSFAVQLLMYASPVVYPASLVPEHLQLAYALNPMVGVIEGFRAALLGSRAMPWDMIGVGAAVAAFLAVSGMFYFRRKEHVFADVA
ncbi:ABC transporter permease [Caenispirillum salinarum]|uniref:ABC transporter permease n=1 Tax=Caenispirillum salinarum TaxID=859058 RepID=UPI00384BEA51